MPVVVCLLCLGEGNFLRLYFRRRKQRAAAQAAQPTDTVPLNESVDAALDDDVDNDFKIDVTVDDEENKVVESHSTNKLIEVV